MINSVNGFEYSKRSPFGDVSSHRGSDYWLAGTERNTENIQGSTLASILPETIILNPDEARKTNNLKIIGWSIASATILAAGVIFFLLRGGPNGITKGFLAIKNYLERKVQKSKLSGMGASAYEYLLGKIDYLLNKSQAVNNFTTIKDFTFKKIMYGGKNNWKYTRKLHNRITSMFEKLGLKTVANSYVKTLSHFENLKNLNISTLAELKKGKDLSKEITINGVKLRKSEWIALVEDKGIQIEQLISDNFSNGVRRARYLDIKKYTKELEQSFDEKGPLWFLSKDTLNSFVADAKMLPKKLQIQKNINKIRNDISYTPLDLYKDADSKIMTIASYFSIEDKNALKILNNLRDNFSQFSKNGKVNKNVVLSNLSSLEAEVKHLFVLTEKNAELRNCVQELRDIFINYRRGNVQEILDVYKALLPQEQYEKLSKEFSKAVKSLDKSVKLETEDFINKSRDLALGSAPTDILSVLGGLGTLSYYLGKSDNGQERTAIALKYGIPALVGVGVSLYGNARLFAGSKSLCFAVISSFIANRLGSFANHLYENYLKKTGQYIEPTKELTKAKTA